MTKPLLAILLLLPLFGCNSIPVTTVDEIFDHPKVQIESRVVDMSFEAYTAKLEIEQIMVPLARSRWLGGERVYKFQRISANEARYIATWQGSLYGLFIIEPSGQWKTRIVSYDFGAMPGHKEQFDILSSW